jgi:hypothetical protein
MLGGIGNAPKKDGDAMKDRGAMSDELSDFEARLSRLAPAEVIDRDALIFKAGQAAGARTRRRRQFLATAAMCLASGAAAFIALRLQPRVVEVDRVVYVQSQEAASVRREPFMAAYAAPESFATNVGMSEFSYFRLRQRVLEEGLAALPAWFCGAGDSKDPARLRDELLQSGNTNS